MKKIINDPNNVVAETLKGLEYANDKLVYVEELEVIAKKETYQGEVQDTNQLTQDTLEKECLMQQLQEMYFHLQALIEL